MNKILNLWNYFINIADNIRPHASGLVDLSLRIWIALVFWKSGILKLSNWDSTLFLFEDEYKVPFLPFELAAYLGTFNEIVMPILLVLGLGTRFAAVPLIFTAAVIQFTYTHHHDHFIWACVLFIIMIRGAGLYSWDYFIANRCCKNDVENKCSLSHLISLIIVSILTVIVAHEALSLVIDSFNPWLDGMLECWNKIGK